MTIFSDTLNTIFLWYGLVVVFSAVRGVTTSTRESAAQTAAWLRERVGRLFGDDTDDASEPDEETNTPVSETPMADAAIARMRARRAEAARAEAARAEETARTAPGRARRPIRASDVLYGFAATAGWTLGTVARYGWHQAEDQIERRRTRRTGTGAEDPDPAGPSAAPAPTRGQVPAPAAPPTAPTPGPAPRAEPGPQPTPAENLGASPTPATAAGTSEDGDASWLSAWGQVLGPAPAQSDAADDLPRVPHLSLVPDPPEEPLMSAEDITSLETLFAWTRQGALVAEMEGADARAAANAASEGAEMTSGTAARVQREVAALNTAIDVMGLLGLDSDSIGAFIEWRERHAFYQQCAAAFAQGFADLIELGRQMADAAASTQEGAALANHTLHVHQDPHLEAAEATGHSGAHGTLYGVDDTRSSASLPAGN